MKATDLLVQCLEAEGVKTVFGIPGEENIHLLDSLSQSSIQFILTRHEQAAAFMADVYARITGKAGVCLSTLGPGATNLITGVANAHLEHSAVVAITGQVTTAELHKQSHQNIDTTLLFAPITKFNQQVLSADTIPEIIRGAFQSASMEPRGTAHVQLPDDVSQEETARVPLPPRAESRTRPTDASLREVARLHGASANPVILAGNGVIRHRVWSHVSQLVEKTNTPLVTTYMAKGILPFEHPLNLFTIGSASDSPGLGAIRGCDLIIAIGVDRVEIEPSFWSHHPIPRVIHIHTTPSESDNDYPVMMDIVGDLGLTLEALIPFAPHRPHPKKLHRHRVAQLERLYSLSSPAEALPRDIMLALSDILPAYSYVIADVGLHKVWAGEWYQPRSPGRTIIFNGFCSMGGSLPGAIACSFVDKEHPVVLLTGDAGFLMNSQELETATRLGLAFTMVVFVDWQLSLIKEHQKDAHLSVTGVEFTNPDFALYAKSFGVGHQRVRTIREFTEAMIAALSSHALNLIEVILTPV